MIAKNKKTMGTSYPFRFFKKSPPFCFFKITSVWSGSIFEHFFDFPKIVHFAHFRMVENSIEKFSRFRFVWKEFAKPPFPIICNFCSQSTVKKKMRLDFFAVGFILTGCMIRKRWIPEMPSDRLYEASSYEKTAFLVYRRKFGRTCPITLSVFYEVKNAVLCYGIIV